MVWSAGKLHQSYPDDWPPVLLHHHFLRVGNEHPDRPAIVCGKATWSYRYFSSQAKKYATALVSAGLAPGDRLVLRSEPIPQALALLTACSMCGVIFVPVSPEAPVDWLSHIAQCAQPVAVVHQAHQPLEGFWQGALNGWFEDDDLPLRDEIPNGKRSRPGPVLESDTAYIIFTSGTTGKPKGIMISHRAVLAFYRALVHHCGLDTCDRVGTFAPLNFDFSILDMGLAFGSGATLVQVPRSLFHQPKRYTNYLRTHRVTQMNGVPSIWTQLLRHCPELVGRLNDLHSILFAGELFPIPDLLHLRRVKPGLRVINCFGQSESVACTFHDVPCDVSADTENISIGTAHPGMEMLLLDHAGHEIHDPGIVGEIYLRGAGLFSGYWQDPNATQRALVPHPLRPGTGEQVFRTGDTAYKDVNGNYYFCGRRDLQVKVRGNRVEIEEVQQKLQTHPSIRQAAVMPDPDAPDQQLVAYVVFRGHQQPEDSELYAFCRELLPSYMWPARFIPMSQLPVTPNGKLDRARLNEDHAALSQGASQVTSDTGPV